MVWAINKSNTHKNSGRGLRPKEDKINKFDSFTEILDSGKH